MERRLSFASRIRPALSSSLMAEARKIASLPQTEREVARMRVWVRLQSSGASRVQLDAFCYYCNPSNS